MQVDLILLRLHPFLRIILDSTIKLYTIFLHLLHLCKARGGLTLTTHRSATVIFAGLAYRDVGQSRFFLFVIIVISQQNTKDRRLALPAPIFRAG